MSISIKYEEVTTAKYPCKFCNKEYRSTKSLKEHTESVHEGKTRNCTIDNCDFTATRRDHLRFHIRSAHFNEQTQCNLCDYQAKHKGHLTEHVLNVHDEGATYNCSIQNCDFTANKRRSLRIHINSVHLNHWHSCNLCDYKSAMKSHLTEHIKYMHIKIEDEICTECNKSVQKRYLTKHMRRFHSDGQLKFSCNLCKFQTTYKSSLTEHIEYRHLKSENEICTECNKSVQKRYMTKHMRRFCSKSSDVKFIIEDSTVNNLTPEDNTTYNDVTENNLTEKDIKNHEDSKQSIIKKYQCQLCEKQYINTRNLNTHIKSVHEGVTYNCSIQNCEYIATRRDSLRRHIRSEHFNEVHQCHLCDYQSKNKNHLTEHIRYMHEKIDNTRCIECNKSVQERYLSKHMKRFHSEGQPKYSCKLCKFQTIYKDCMKMHISRKHVNFDDVTQ